jgi:DNA polymerase-3 subunit alpha
MEKEMLGFYISGHPLSHVKDKLETQVTLRLADLPDKKEGAQVVAGGILAQCRRLTTKKKEAMLVANLEDLSGAAQVVVFPKSFEKYAPLLGEDCVVIIRGKVNRDMRSDELNIVVDSVESLDAYESRRTLFLDMDGLSDADKLSRVKEIIDMHPGADPIFMQVDGKMVEPGDDCKVTISPELVQEMEDLLGEDYVKVEIKSFRKESSLGQVEELVVF